MYDSLDNLRNTVILELVPKVLFNSSIVGVVILLKRSLRLSRVIKHDLATIQFFLTLILKGELYHALPTTSIKFISLCPNLQGVIGAFLHKTKETHQTPLIQFAHVHISYLSPRP